MNPQRMLGIAVLAVGVILLVVGMNATDSVADKLSNTFTGRYTDQTTWYIIGGIAAGIVGLGMMVYGPKGKNT